MPIPASFSTKLNFPQYKDCFEWVQLKSTVKERDKRVNDWVPLGQPEIIELLRFEKTLEVIESNR